MSAEYLYLTDNIHGAHCVEVTFWGPSMRKESRWRFKWRDNRGEGAWVIKWHPYDLATRRCNQSDKNLADFAAALFLDWLEDTNDTRARGLHYHAECILYASHGPDRHIVLVQSKLQPKTELPK